MRKQLMLFMLLLFGISTTYATVGLKIEAENFSERSEADNPRNVSDATLSGGGKLAYIWHGYWVKYSNVTFDGSEDKIQMSVVSYGGGGEVQFRLGAVDGTLIATATVGSTGIVETALSATTGTYDLYLVFVNESYASWLYDIDYFKLTSASYIANATAVSETSTLTWVFNTGVEGQTATYSGSTGDYFNADEVTIGSNLNYSGTETYSSSANITVTRFTPDAKDYGYTNSKNKVAFNIKPKPDLKFEPTTISFDCARFGTSGGMIDVIWRSANGTGTTIGTDIKPNRSGTDPEITHVDIDLSGYTLNTWDGDCSLEVYITELDPGKRVGLANITITGAVSGDMASLASYTLTTSADPSAGGSVANLPAGTEFDSGTEIELTATDNFGYNFDHWEDAEGSTVSSSNPYTFTISDNTTLNAVFVAVNTYSLTTNISNGTLDVSPAGTDVEGVIKYETGTTITCTAHPAYGYQLTNWTDGADSELSTSNPYSFDISGNSTVNANINKTEVYALPSWTFAKQYSQTSGEVYTYHTPKLDGGTSTISGTPWIYPNTITTGSNVGLTVSGGTLQSQNTSGNYDCRIVWSGTNSGSGLDFTNAANHSIYYQFQFSTKGFTGIGVDMTFGGGQNLTDDYLDLVYSVDNGSTWIDGGKFNSGSHWSTFNNYTPSLSSADDKDLVIVRLIAISENDGSNNFNLDAFTVTGTLSTTTWDGESSTGFDVAANWNNGVPSGISVVIPSGLTNYPTISSATTVNNLTIESDATLLGTENLTVSGTATVKRSLSTDSWQYISAPVSGATANDIEITSDGESAYVMKYDNTISGVAGDASLGWTYLTKDTDPLTPGVGYAVWVTEPKTIEFTGTLATGDQTISSVSAGESAWKLIGNSALGYIDWSSVSSDDDITGSAYVYDPTLNSGAGGYGTIGSDGTPVNAGSDFIPPMQGFFVEVDGGGNAELSLPTSALSHSSQAFYKSASVQRNFVRLAVQNSTCSDETVIYQKENAANGYHSKTDAHKMFMNGSDVPQLYSLADEHKLAINTLSELPVSIPLNIDAAIAETVTLKALELKDFDQAVNLYLEDKLNGELINLKEVDSYDASIKVGSNSDRFVLHMTSQAMSATVVGNETKVFAVDHQLVIRRAESTPLNISVYNVGGQCVAEYCIEGNKSILNTDLIKGVYIVKLHGQGTKQVEKVVFGN